MDEVAARAHATLARLTAGTAVPALGVALSGGGDSVALLHLAATWDGRGRVLAATVDHGLRPGSAAEAEAAGRMAARLGVGHRVLPWRDRGAGNLMAAARAARLRLLSAWARAKGLDVVLLGHTSDDVAETLLLRLNRGAGLDGLAEMAEAREAAGMRFLRPLLGVGRDTLRGWLTARGIGWIDDPSNADPRFDRARLRAALAAAGLEPARIADSARHLDAARAALRLCAAGAAAGTVVARGTVRLPDLTAAPEELRRLILLAAVACVTGEALPPRHAAVRAALDALAQGRRAGLGGAILTPAGLVLREPAAAARAAPLVGDGVWDRRWRLSGLPPGTVVRALGPAPQRPAGMSAAEAAASPALWRDGRLVGAPLLAPVAGVAMTALPDLARFEALLRGRPPNGD